MYRKPFTSLRGLDSLLFLALVICLASTEMQAAAEANPQTVNSSADDVRVSIVPRVRPEAKSTSDKKSADVKVDVKIVLIPVSVTDTYGKPFTGLKRESFKVFENGVEQRIQYFSNEDAPMSVGLLVDASGSMEKSLDQSRGAAGHLFKKTMNGDEFFLVQFSDAPKVLCGFTQDTGEIQNSLNFIRAKGWTSLLDAVYLGISKMKRARNSRQALVVLSDGADNNSRYSESEIRSLVRESDVTIYSIAIVGGGFTKRSAKLLSDLAQETGGKFFAVNSANDLPEAMDKISAAMRDQYILGYAPADTQSDGKYRKVQVKLTPIPDTPPLHATWRVGYYAPVSLY